MTTYARLDPITLLVRDTVDLTAQQYAALNGNPKQAFIRPLVIDAQPTPTSAQIVVRGPYVVEAARVRQTWLLQDKTAGQIAAEAAAADRATELQQLRLAIAALQAGTGTAAERLVRLERVCVRLLKDAAP